MGEIIDLPFAMTKAVRILKGSYFNEEKWRSVKVIDCIGPAYQDNDKNKEEIGYKIKIRSSHIEAVLLVLDDGNFRVENERPLKQQTK